MTSSMAKIAVAAGIVIAVVVFGLSKFPAGDHGRPGVRNLLSTACAAEESLFAGTKIVHIQNEIIVQGVGTGGPAPELNDNWLPMCSLKPDGQLRTNQLQLPAAPESYVVTDHSWYDPLTGCFARVLKMGEAVVFGNAYDGRFVYDAIIGAGSVVQVSSQIVSSGFKPPQSPAEYLGLAAGLKSALAQDDSMVQSVEPGTLADGAPVHIFKVGMSGPDGQLPGWWLFKVRDDDSTIAEKEFVLLGRSRLLIRRVVTESVEKPAISWNLSEIAGTGVPAAQPVSVAPDMVIPNVSVQHMVEHAAFETYVFSTQPAWTGAVQITDCIDPVTPGGRMFILTARADDHRHIVVVQSPTYNAMSGHVVKKEGTLVYTSPNGFKVWGGGPQKWFSQILLQSARAFIQDPPSEDRTGYILESPAGTFPALAINGPISDEELHKLVDSLTPARGHLNNQANSPDKK